jgi:hypothetical protein
VSTNSNYVHWAFWASVADVTHPLKPKVMAQMSAELEELAENIARCWIEEGRVPELKEGE